MVKGKASRRNLVVLVPVCGSLVVGMLNSIKEFLDNQSGIILPSNVRAAIQPFLKAVAASVTLATGNSLGPEGPSVEIGTPIAKGVGSLLGTSTEKHLPLIAAGSAAGISSGFNAAVAGCFFAVESVLWPSPSDDYSSLTNSTSMVILSGVIAAVISEVGLGSVPAFTVPGYDFRSPSGGHGCYSCRSLSGTINFCLELTQDYRIVLPLLGAVGLSSWVSSTEYEK